MPLRGLIQQHQADNRLDESTKALILSYSENLPNNMKIESYGHIVNI